MPNPVKKPKAIEVFRHGTHTPMEGNPITFTASQVGALVRNYDPNVFKAPLVIGHPKTDDPAYGWVESVALSAEGKVLAQPEADTLEPQFAAMVAAGRFRKVSVSLFPPEHPANPKPGEFYLKHVGFLGAAAPAVSGLKPAAFASADAGLVEIEFGSVDTWSLKRILRGLRDYLVEKEGAEKGDEIVPGYALDSLELPDPPANAGPCYATNPEDEPMPTQNPNDNAAREAAFAERDTALTARENAIKAREEAAAKAAAATRLAGATAFAETLVAAGKLTPANKEQLVVALAAVDAIEAPVEFAEGDGKKSEAPGVILRRLLSAAKPFVALGAPERATGENAPDATSIAGFAAPDGAMVDMSEAALHAKAIAHQRAHPNMSYLEAVSAVSAG